MNDLFAKLTQTISMRLYERSKYFIALFLEYIQPFEPLQRLRIKEVYKCSHF
jgi:hypothetical protein